LQNWTLLGTEFVMTRELRCDTFATKTLRETRLSTASGQRGMVDDNAGAGG